MRIRDNLALTAGAIPFYMMALAWLTSLLIFAQFLMAGLSLFQNGAIWRCHTMAGFLLAIPIGLMSLLAWIKRMSGFRWMLALLVVTYFVQILLIVATRNGAASIWQALHPFNGSLMLALSLAVVGQTTRGRSAALRRATRATNQSVQ